MLDTFFRAWAVRRPAGPKHSRSVTSGHGMRDCQPAPMIMARKVSLFSLILVSWRIEDLRGSVHFQLLVLS